MLRSNDSHQLVNRRPTERSAKSVVPIVTTGRYLTTHLHLSTKSMGVDVMTLLASEIRDVQEPDSTIPFASNTETQSP